MKRRNFIQQVGALTATGWLVSHCGNDAKKKIPGSIVGAAAKAGHLLRDHKIPSVPQSQRTTDVVIVGAGVSGLSAARRLQQQGVNNFMVLDLEDHAGGNAASGENKVSAYPWGAHYVPIPNNDLTDYLAFLQDCNVVTGYDEKGLPIYNDYHLCFDPEERLYLNGSWQEGLIPRNGLPAEELKQVERFLQQMEEMRYATGKDGKDAFAIPVSNSSADEQYVQLDGISMKEWLLQNNYTSTYLHWYCNYCTRDDFGTRYEEIAAWAGIHYFAARKGKAANAAHQDVLTWSQGNGWLVEQLQKTYTDKIHLGSLVTSIRETAQGVEVLYLDVASSQLHSIMAKKCIVAIPQFIAQRLLLPDAERAALIQQHFTYAPWMVANITTTALQERRGYGLCWDNVVYNAASLGYVDATHQRVQQKTPQKVLTWYLPLTQDDPLTARRKATTRTHDEWVQMILTDLTDVHEDIASTVSNIDIMVWGHGMIRPVKHFIHGGARREVGKPINDTIYFAHTDIAGISIFEEAFYQGLHAADAIAKMLAT